MLQWVLILAAASAGLGAAGATAATAEASDATGSADSGSAAHAQSPHHSVHERQSASPLDRRVHLLAVELDLDSAQQAQVKKLLLDQRDLVSRVWNDTSTPAALRVSATQAISDRTSDQIRALLNEEQRKKYIQARNRDAQVGVSGARVDAWSGDGKRQ